MSTTAINNRRGHSPVRRSNIETGASRNRLACPRRPVTNFDVLNHEATGLQAKPVYALHLEPYQEKTPDRIRGQNFRNSKHFRPQEIDSKGGRTFGKSRYLRDGDPYKPLEEYRFKGKNFSHGAASAAERGLFSHTKGTLEIDAEHPLTPLLGGHSSRKVLSSRQVLACASLRANSPWQEISSSARPSSAPSRHFGFVSAHVSRVWDLDNQQPDATSPHATMSPKQIDAFWDDC